MVVVIIIVVVVLVAAVAGDGRHPQTWVSRRSWSMHHYPATCAQPWGACEEYHEDSVILKFQCGSCRFGMRCLSRHFLAARICQSSGMHQMKNLRRPICHNGKVSFLRILSTLVGFFSTWRNEKVHDVKKTMCDGLAVSWDAWQFSWKHLEAVASGMLLRF